ncbi:hypothetical protein [Agathobacter sp.]
MNLIKVKIEKDDNTIKYIKIIREYDNTVSIGELKKKIDANDTVIGFDLDNRDWINMENMTEYKLHREFYSFIQTLIKNGAKVEMTYEYEVSGYGIQTEQLDMKSLDRLIKFNKEIWDEVENNPD